MEVVKGKPKTLHEAMDIAVRTENYLGRGHSGSFGAYRNASNGFSAASSSAGARNYGEGLMDLNNIEFDSMDAEEKYGGARSRPGSVSHGAVER